jgi:hypothetical protein
MGFGAACQWESAQIKAHIGIGAVTRTVLATSMHINSLDPPPGIWQAQVPGAARIRLTENMVVGIVGGCAVRAPAEAGRSGS